MAYFKEYHLETDAKALFKLAGFEVVSLSVRRGGPGRGGFTWDPGIPDAYIRHPNGTRAFVEFKLPGRKVRPEQVAWHKDERRCGGDVWLVRDLSDIVRYCSEVGIELILEESG